MIGASIESVTHAAYGTGLESLGMLLLHFQWFWQSTTEVLPTSKRDTARPLFQGSEAKRLGSPQHLLVFVLFLIVSNQRR